MTSWLSRRWRKDTGARQEPVREATGMPPDAGVEYNVEVQIGPLLASEIGTSRTRLPGPPAQFFSQRTLPRLEDGADTDQVMRRIHWYIAYLHHPNAAAIEATLRSALSEQSGRDSVLAGIAVFRLPELLAHKAAAVRRAAAALYWECTESSRRHALIALSGTGAIATSGFHPGVASEVVVNVLRPTCPNSLKESFACEVKDILGIDISELPASLARINLVFEGGELVVAPGAARIVQEDLPFAKEIVTRHLSGDWGNVPPGDKARNDGAVRAGRGMILSSYKWRGGTEIWVITESDRSRTTVLLPGER